MNDQQVMHAMYIDDSYETQRVLADAVGGKTELVTFEGTGPFVRKKIPVELARRRVWSTLADCACKRLPQVELTYELPDQFVVVYDFVPGQTLESQVKPPSKGDVDPGRAKVGSADAQNNSYPLHLDVAVELACDICEAAQALHEHGIVHRDISPANVVISGDGAHLIDLGIARMRVEGASRDTASLGTWGFASPEQYGFAQTDARSDVYSIGRLLGFALTGVTPGDQAYDVALKDATLVPPKVRAVINRACAFEPSSRYQTAAELASALRYAMRPDEVEEPENAACKKNDGDIERVQTQEAAGAPSERGDASAGRTGGLPIRTVGHVGEGSVPENENRSKRRRRLLVGTVAVTAVAAVCCVVVSGALAPDARQAEMSEPQPVTSGSSIGDSESEANAGLSTSNTLLSDSPSASLAPDAASLLEVTESGWSTDPSGYVHYALALRNSSDVAIEFPTVRIVGKAQGGTVLFSEEKPLMVIDAQQTVLFGSQAGNGQVPATVEFEALEPRDYYIGSRSNVPAYTVSGVSESHDRFGGTTFTGMVEMTAGQADDDMVAVSVVLRDDAGSIVGGYSGFVTCDKVGQKAAFEVQAQNAPEYASFEVFAQQW